MSKEGPFRADHVGSLLRPPELLQARERYRAGEITQDDLRKEEDKHIRDVAATQERVGLHAITDGEFRRHMFHTDFLTQFEGVEEIPSEYEISFRGAKEDVKFAPPTLAVTGKVKHDKDIQVADFKYLQSVTEQTPKVAVPSPSMLHFRGGRGAIDEKAYPDLDDFFKDLVTAYQAEIDSLAKAGCRYVQMDDTNLAYLCDSEHRERARQIGEDPDKLPGVYARLISDCFKNRPDDMAATIHLCRGNFRGAWAAEGGYEPVAEALFNECDIDGFFLEFDDPSRSGGFEPLRFVPKGKTIVLGLVSSKVPEMESKDDLKRRIEEASQYVDPDYLALSPQCGFASDEKGNPVTPEDQEAKLRLVLETAEEVWGTAK